MEQRSRRLGLGILAATLKDVEVEPGRLSKVLDSLAFSVAVLLSSNADAFGRGTAAAPPLAAQILEQR